MTTPINALRYPAGGAAPNGPAAIGNIAADLDTRLIPRFTSTGSRDSTITSPTTGMVCAVLGVPYVYRASAWRLVGMAGTLLGAADGTSRTLPSSSQIGVTGTSVTIVLAEQRRVRAVVSASVQQATATQGNYKIWPSYNAGSSATGGSSFGVGNTGGGPGINLYASLSTEESVLLAAGTWTFYITAARVTGGSSTDSVEISHIALYDAGST